MCVAAESRSAFEGATVTVARTAALGVCVVAGWSQDVLARRESEPPLEDGVFSATFRYVVSNLHRTRAMPTRPVS